MYFFAPFVFELQGALFVLRTSNAQHGEGWLPSFSAPLSRTLMGTEPSDMLDFANASYAVVVSVRVLGI